jgi:hypothetical protein
LGGDFGASQFSLSKELALAEQLEIIVVDFLVLEMHGSYTKCFRQRLALAATLATG